MGTRNLTIVQFGGEYKIAQYGQWDGYTEGQGATILGFLLESGNKEKLKNALSRVRFIDSEGKDKEFIEEYDKNAPEWSSEPDKRTPEQKRWFETYITRNIGGEILGSVANSKDLEILLKDSIDFAADSLMCEWAYVVDFDNNTFEIFKGFNQEPLAEDERFKNAVLEKDYSSVAKEYKPVKLFIKYDLDNLPDVNQMIEDCTVDEED